MNHPGHHRIALVFSWMVFVLVLSPSLPVAAQNWTIPEGSLIIPMDVQYQNHGMLQAYGLVYRLLEHRIPVYWITNTAKTMLRECDPAAGCPWDCADPIDDGPCRFPTFTPDFWADSVVVWDDAGLRPPGTSLPFHGYRGAPFMIYAEDAQAARAVIDAWNDPALWPEAPWAARDVFAVVSVHEARVPFEVFASLRLLEHLPRPAIVADGGETLYAAVLRAAGIPMSNGAPFTDELCTPGACGPGTPRPDLLPLELLNPERGSCLSQFPPKVFTPLLDGEGKARHTHLALAGFSVEQRESVTCEGGPCGQVGSHCFASPLEFHGHRALHQIGAFKEGGGWIFAVGEAVHALENATKLTHWPMLDHTEPGHFAVRTPVRTTCPCHAPGYECVHAGCYNEYTGIGFSCCIPTDPVVRGTVVLPVPAGEAFLGELGNPSSAGLQFDGDMGSTLGPQGLLGLLEPHGTKLLVYGTRTWISSDGDGYLALATGGAVNYLADVNLGVGLPVTEHPDTNLSRLYLNTLFRKNQLPGTAGPEPAVKAERSSWGACPERWLPLRRRFEFQLDSNTRTTADWVQFEMELTSDVGFVTCTPEAVTEGRRLSWHINRFDESSFFACLFDFPVEGDYPLITWLHYSFMSTFGKNGSIRDDVLLEIRDSTDTNGDGLPQCHPCDDHPGYHDRTVDCGVSGDPVYPEYDRPWPDEPEPARMSGGCACAAGIRDRDGSGTRLPPGLLFAILLVIMVRRCRMAPKRQSVANVYTGT